MIIGLYGDSRAGKDTVAKIAHVKRGYEWRSFARPLKQVLYEINPWLPSIEMSYQEAVDNFGEDWVKKNDPSSVDMMIALGQGIRDHLHEDAWLWGVMTDPIPKNMIISDVRQPNEYEAIIRAGGEVWKIVRAGTTRRSMDGLLDDREFPVVIFNNADHNALENIVCWEIDEFENRWNRSGENDRASGFLNS